jgi:hypothetical protein
VIRPAQVLDGYGLPFDPARHLAFVLAARGDELFSIIAPALPAYGAGNKHLPAGFAAREGHYWDYDAGCYARKMTHSL